MKLLTSMGVIALLLAGCSGSDSGGPGFSGTLCQDVCAWPSSCFDQFAPTVSNAECLESCDASIDLFGEACLEAINATVYCLGSCREEDITVDDINRCQGTALQIDSACD